MPNMNLNVIQNQANSFRTILILIAIAAQGCSTGRIHTASQLEAVTTTKSSAEKNTPAVNYYSEKQVLIDPALTKSALSEEDQKKLSDLEILLTSGTQKDSKLSCPGLKLVVSCGNGSCESNLGETANNCAADCVPAPVVSYNNQTRCTETQAVFHPTNVGEVQGIVKMAALNNKKVKVIGNSHSANSILCTDGFTIVTDRMNQPVRIENFEGEDTVLTEAGTTIWDLNEWLYARGKSLGYPIMGFRGVTIAGAMGTSSHGSSTQHNAVISNQVQSITLVDGLGNIRELSKNTTDPDTWKAATASLGMLGVITHVRLKVRKAFQLDTRVTFHSEKELFKKNGVFGPVQDCDWGVMNWFPGARKFMKICGKETQAKADPGANNVLLSPAIPGSMVNISKQMLQYSACKNGVACFIDKLRYSMLKLTPPLQKLNARGKKVATRRAIGPAHRMQSSFLTPHQKGFFQMDWEIAVPKSRANEAMAWIMEHIRKNNICLPLVGVFLRFTPALDESLLGYTNAGEDFIQGEPVVYIEMPVYLPVGFSDEQKANYDRPFEELARNLVSRFGARAHWGKNRDWVFELQRDLNVYRDRTERFKAVVNQLDPQGLFRNRYSEMIGL